MSNGYSIIRDTQRRTRHLGEPQVLDMSVSIAPFCIVFIQIMFRLDLSSKILANYPPNIRASVLYLWDLEIQFRDLPTQLFFLGQYVSFSPALVTVGLGVPKAETEKAIFILEKAGCIYCFMGKYQSILSCSLPPMIVTTKNAFRRTHRLGKKEQPRAKNLKLRQLLGVA